jgi:hypothetical protein
VPLSFFQLTTTFGQDQVCLEIRGWRWKGLASCSTLMEYGGPHSRDSRETNKAGKFDPQVKSHESSVIC